MRSAKVKDMVLCAMFTVLIAAGAFLRVPVPMVPFTLQCLFTMLAGLLLGPRRGLAAVGLYIALGLLGVPVFTQGGGPGYIFQPTFGYILGFAAGAYVTGVIARGGIEYKRLLAANFAGLAVVYLFGVVYYGLICRLYLGTPVGMGTLLLYCFLLPVPGDIALCFVGAALGRRLIPLLRAERMG